MKNDRVLNREQLRKYLRGHMAGYKIPQFFFAWPDIIPTVGIKLNRLFFQELATEKLK